MVRRLYSLEVSVRDMANPSYAGSGFMRKYLIGDDTGLPLAPFAFNCRVRQRWLILVAGECVVVKRHKVNYTFTVSFEIR